MLQAGKTGELWDSAHRSQDQPLASIFSHSPKAPSDDSHSFLATLPVHTSNYGLFFLLFFFKNIERENLGLARNKRTMGAAERLQDLASLPDVP